MNSVPYLISGNLRMHYLADKAGLLFMRINLI